MKQFFSRLALSLLAVAGIAFLGFVSAFIVTIYGGMIFYTPLVGIAAAGLALYAILRIFDAWTPRLLNIGLASFTALCLLAAGGYAVNNAYHNSFAKLSEQEVNLSEYAPFTGKAIAVLDDTPDLKLENDLPRMDGATALYPLYASFAQAVYPEGEYHPYDPESSIVVCMTTPEAYNRLLRGETDIIFVAGPSDAQLRSFERAGKEMVMTPIGREAFVFFVNERNPVDGLSTRQIKDIYAGKLTRWSEVGGGSGDIRAFQRPDGSGSQSMLQSIMKGESLMTPPTEDVADLMSGIISRTADYRNYKDAMGYSFLHYATEMNRNGEIKLLAVDGVAPNADNIANGTYPMAKEFYAITAGAPGPDEQRLIDWILSPQGQELVWKTGYVPLHGEAVSSSPQK